MKTVSVLLFTCSLVVFGAIKFYRSEFIFNLILPAKCKQFFCKIPLETKVIFFILKDTLQGRIQSFWGQAPPDRKFLQFASFF